MSTKLALTLVGTCLLLAALQVRAEEVSLELEALLGKTAVLMINGQRSTLRVGEAADGVTLVATQPTTATVEINGKAETLGLTQRVGTAYQPRDELVVTIARDAAMQYQTSATINGRSTLVLVDTGANMMAISSDAARALGIDYSGGRPSMVETASGQTPAHGINLRSVIVGEIEVNNVPAMVVEGAFPTTILLGMSFLRHVKLQEHNGILSLSRSP
ncbi:MAG: TIGR02281 family clan AA aspartic protease [Candidatus Accumulibacter sp.]|nr:TIGR02281 family clan AA aspartic protease [Accumulibacter sp.]